jgi:hypothetical protein
LDRRQTSEEIMNISDLVADPSAKWGREPPADPEAIRSLIAGAGVDLPEDYLSLLRLSNGGEGELGVEPGWFRLWPAGEVIDLNRDYEVAELAPGFFAFGSSGGGLLGQQTGHTIDDLVAALPGLLDGDVAFELKDLL